MQYLNRSVCTWINTLSFNGADEIMQHFISKEYEKKKMKFSKSDNCLLPTFSHWVFQYSCSNAGTWVHNLWSHVLVQESRFLHRFRVDTALIHRLSVGSLFMAAHELAQPNFPYACIARIALARYRRSQCADNSIFPEQNERIFQYKCGSV